MSKHFTYTYLYLLLTSLAFPAIAQSNPSESVPTTTLSDINILHTANRFNTTTINRNDLQLQQATDMADVFANEPSVSVGGGARNAQRIYLRGIDSGNLNVTIDGATQGRSLHQHRGTIGSIDPELLKQVAIQAGPSADAGPGALGGGIRFETVDAQDLLRQDQNIGFIARTGYYSADKAKRGGLTVYGLAANHVGLLAHVNAINRDNYREGGGSRVPNSAGQDRDYMFKLSVLDVYGHSVRLGASRSQNTGLYLFGSTGSDMGYAPDDSVPTRQRIQRDTYTLEHRFQRDDNPWLDWRLNLYANRNKLTDEDVVRSSKTESYGGSARNTFSFDVGLVKNSFTVGADYVYEEGTTDGMGPAFLVDSGTSTTAKNLGIFLQNTMLYGPLRVMAGLRYDRYSTDYGPYHMSDSDYSPSISAELSLGHGFSVHGSYGQAVRASGSIPMGFLTRVDANTNFNDGRPLEAEKSRSSELGLSYRGTGLLIDNDQLSAKISYFNTHIDNMIEWVGGGMTYPAYIRNMPGTLRTKGWEVRATWGVEKYQTTLAFVKTDVTADGEPLGVVRRQGASLGDRFTWSNQWQVTPEISLAYHLNAVRRLKDIPAGSIGRPGYVLHDIQAQWEPRAIRGLSINLAVNNLTDKRYSSQSSIAAADSILIEPGRDVRLTLKYQY